MKRFYLLMALCIMILALVGCGGGGGNHSGPIAPTITTSEANNLLDNFVSAHKSENVDTILNLFDNPFSQYDTDDNITTTVSHNELRTELEENFSTYEIVDYSLNNRTVTINGNVATVDCIMQITMKNKSTSVETTDSNRFGIEITNKNGTLLITKEIFY